jgi:hypothetical protein
MKLPDVVIAHLSEIIIGICSAFFGAFFKNLGTLIHILQPSGSKPFNGEWTGAAKEWNDAKKAFELGNDIVMLREKSSIKDKVRIKGTVTTTASGHRRSWEVNGTYYKSGNILVLTYSPADSPRASVGAYVLSGKPENGRLHGYWLGFDAERKHIMAGPYVLAKDLQDTGKDPKYEHWLNQKCYEYLDSEPTDQLASPLVK